MLRSAFPLVFQLPHRKPPPIRPPRPQPVRRYASPAAAAVPPPPPPPRPLPPASAYVHLPFCRKRCHYCDFPIVALGSSAASPGGAGDGEDPRIADYVRLLLREVAATRPVSDDGVPLQTIFFGGGTPSLVPPRLVAAVLDALRGRFGLSACPEVSIEMDPGTFDAAKLRELVGVGVNRVSLGVQAFQEELLRACGRAHGLREVHEAVGIVTGNMAPRPSYTPGVFPLPNETDSANFYKIASKRLSEAGYQHYEISSYCKPGYECKHNVTYWQNRPFYAFGLGSASYINGVRYSRPRGMKNYADWVQKLEDGTWCHESSVSETKDMAMDSVMLSLRTARGLDLHSFSKSFGEGLTRSLCDTFRPFVESGLVIPMDKEREALQFSEFESDLESEGEMTGSRVAFLRLSDPDGFLLSNELISLAFGTISP
ncbi:unnamed protein product [Triticum turgidum subsp. durum]|uniref:Elp3/MiaA/NifB-like radical SAM core domain-containing protein n=1 Tax=Triticum turgidum subsp. durum TaxID=4567 RepID=A0A9R0VDV8_TRITD|nr:unnamed protein product [Triticum turgidum subsp. durum]